MSARKPPRVRDWTVDWDDRRSWQPPALLSTGEKALGRAGLLATRGRRVRVLFQGQLIYVVTADQDGTLHFVRGVAPRPELREYQ